MNLQRFTQRLILLSFLLISSAEAVCDRQQEEPITTLFLLPLDAEQGVMGQALLDGVIAAEEEPLEQQCEVEFRYLDTRADHSAESLWQQVLEAEPDLLFGPLLPATQQSLSEIEGLALADGMVWVDPGMVDRFLPEWNGKGRLGFSAGRWESIRNLLEYGWAQGENSIALLFPEGDAGERLVSRIQEWWEPRGGVVSAIAHYGRRYSELDLAMRGLLSESRGEFDLLLVLADDYRLQMVRPLMNYHGRTEPVYSVTPPSGVAGQKRDLDGVIYPLQPALLERGVEVDDLLLQMENIGYDLMMLIRQGGVGYLQEKDSFFGRSGRYSIEQGKLLRALCIVRQENGKKVVLYCPEEFPEKIDGAAGKHTERVGTAADLWETSEK